MSSLRWEQHQGDEQLMGCYHRNYNTFSFTVVLSPSLSTSLPLTLSLSTFVLHVLSAIPLLLIVRTLTRLQHRRLSSWSNVTAPANADIPKLFHFFSSSHFPPPFFFFVHFSAFCPVCHGISFRSLPLCAACSRMAQAEALKSAVCFNECISEWLCARCCRFRGLRALQCYLAPGSGFSLTFFPPLL